MNLRNGERFTYDIGQTIVLVAIVLPDKDWFPKMLRLSVKSGLMDVACLKITLKRDFVVISVPIKVPKMKHG